MEILDSYHAFEIILHSVRQHLSEQLSFVHVVCIRQPRAISIKKLLFSQFLVRQSMEQGFHASFRFAELITNAAILCFKRVLLNRKLYQRISIVSDDVFRLEAFEFGLKLFP